MEYVNNLALNAFFNFKNEIENKSFKNPEIDMYKHPFERFVEEQFKSIFIEMKKDKTNQSKKEEKEEEKKKEEKKMEDKEEEKKKEEELIDVENEEGEKMDVEKEEEKKGEEEVKEIKEKRENNVKNKIIEVKVKNKIKITKKILKNPQRLKTLGDQLQYAANAALDIFERKKFLRILKEKIDEASKEEKDMQNKSILKDMKKIFLLLKIYLEKIIIKINLYIL